MKLIQTVDAEGTVLCHDITQIIKGVTKDAVFRKGHVVTREDIPVLLSVGKDQLYVWEKEDGMLYENDAAEILCDMCKGQNMERSQAKEGKIELTANLVRHTAADNRALWTVFGNHTCGTSRLCNGHNACRIQITCHQTCCMRNGICNAWLLIGITCTKT